MAQQVLDPARFRAMFPMFADPDFYPDEVLQIWWDMGVCAISDTDNAVLHGKCLQTACSLMAAHVGTLTQRAMAGGGATGGPVGTLTAATIDKVSVSYTPPPIRTGWQAYLAQTPWGLQLWALLRMKAAGGFLFGGRPETAAFRKVGGRW